MAKAKSRPKARKRQAPNKRNKRNQVVKAARKLERAIANLERAKAALKNAERRAKGLKRSIKKPKRVKLAKTQKHGTRSLSGALDYLGSLFGQAKKEVRATKSKARKAPKKPRPKRKIPRAIKQPTPPLAPRITVKKLKSGEIRTIAFDVPYLNLEQWLTDLENNPTLNGQIPEGAKLGFRFFGNNSLQTFSSVKDALLRIGAYESTLKAIYDNPEDQLDVYKNVEFVLVESNAANEFTAMRNDYVKDYRKKKRKRKTTYKDTYWTRTKERNPKIYQQQLTSKRAKARARYQRLKNDPEFKAKQRKASAKYARRNK